MAPDKRIEIKEVTHGYDVIDIDRKRWLATFRMFADAQTFAESKVSEWRKDSVSRS